MLSCPLLIAKWSHDVTWNQTHCRLAFKKIFGSPENAAALIGLLNAILKFPQPIVAVEILNPFNYQEFADSKLIVLDVRCRDSADRWLNVEMQVSVYAGLIERLVYYASSMFVDQLSKGSSYADADPALSICLLNHVLFRDTRQAHHRFQMIDRQSGRELQNAIEVHTVELLKYNLDESTICRAKQA
ncbi:MAG: Rpn family recombination-promoting nuclease/putative transposase [Pirellulaceae bacterium]